MHILSKEIQSARFFDLGGTIRSQKAIETLSRIQPLLSPLGITRVASVTGLDNLGVPVAISIRPNAKHLSVSQGKGLSWELAQISAIMESIEGYHAENPRAPELHGSYSALAKHNPVVDLNQFQRGFLQIPDIANWEIGWISGTNLVNEQKIFLPHFLICLDSTQAHPEYSYITVSSNGLASGNSLDEAIFHGMCEVIERDSLSRWGKQSDAERKQTQINLDTVDSALNRQVINHFLAAGLFIKVWDISSQLGIPAFHCVLRDPNILRGLSIFRGTGAHLSKEIALSRALTEAAQSRLTLITGSRDDVFMDHYQQQKLMPLPSADEFVGVRDFHDCISPMMANSFKENIAYLIARLSLENLHSVLVVNHTKAEFNVPVVHVFIPGMQFNGSRI